jgi:hypothetical protein
MTRAIYVPESAFGVCVWRLPNGEFFGDGEGYLSMEGVRGERRVEEKMREAAAYWLGAGVGEPCWIEGRKISRSEWEDQNERLFDGKIPDPVDEIRQIMNRKK